MNISFSMVNYNTLSQSNTGESGDWVWLSSGASKSFKLSLTHIKWRLGEGIWLHHCSGHLVHINIFVPYVEMRVVSPQLDHVFNVMYCIQVDCIPHSVIPFILSPLSVWYSQWVAVMLDTRCILFPYAWLSTWVVPICMRCVVFQGHANSHVGRLVV